MKNLIIHLLFFRWVQSITFFRKRFFSHTRKLATTPILCSQKVSHQCCLAMKSRPPFGVISHSFRAKKQTSPHYIELLPFSVIHFNCIQRDLCERNASGGAQYPGDDTASIVSAGISGIPGIGPIHWVSSIFQLPGWRPRDTHLNIHIPCKHWDLFPFPLSIMLMVQTKSSKNVLIARVSS